MEYAPGGRCVMVGTPSGNDCGPDCDETGCNTTDRLTGHVTIDEAKTIRAQSRPASSCADRLFLEWGPAVCADRRPKVWPYDRTRGACLPAEVQRLGRARRPGFVDVVESRLVPRDNADGVPMTLVFEEGSGSRRAGPPSVFLSRRGFWCTADGRPIVPSSIRPGTCAARGGRAHATRAA